MTPDALAERLRPVHDTLADLEREHYRLANVDHEPDAWATWADLSAALAAVRSAMGRDARAAGYRPAGG